MVKSFFQQINPSYDVTDMQTFDPPVIDISSLSSYSQVSIPGKNDKLHYKPSTVNVYFVQNNNKKESCTQIRRVLAYGSCIVYYFYLQ